MTISGAMTTIWHFKTGFDFIMLCISVQVLIKTCILIKHQHTGLEKTG